MDIKPDDIKMVKIRYDGKVREYEIGKAVLEFGQDVINAVHHYCREADHPSNTYTYHGKMENGTGYRIYVQGLWPQKAAA